MYELWTTAGQGGCKVLEFKLRKEALAYIKEHRAEASFALKLPTGKWYDWSKGTNKPAPDNIPHPPWFIRPRPTNSGLAIIENGTNEGNHIAECEWHIAEFIVKTVNRAYPTKGEELCLRQSSLPPRFASSTCGKRSPCWSADRPA